MKRFLWLLLLALIIRLGVLPFTCPVEGDGAARVFIAWKWLDHPTLFAHGVWGPLHFYMIAAALLVWFDTVYSPILLHVLLSVATVIPLWALVRKLWDESGALFVAAAYLFYPLLFRLSFTPLSEIPHLFFVSLTLYFLNKCRVENRLVHSILAGLCITCGALLRMEAWLLTPLFGLLLWRKWKLMLCYLLTASLGPIIWMTANHLNSLPFLYYLSFASYWQFEMEGFNDNVTGTEMLRRFLFFPSVLFFGLTPLLCLLSMAGLMFAWKEKKELRIWSIPFLGMLSVFMIRGVEGFITTQERFSLILGLLLLPFSAEAIGRIKDRRKKLMVAVLTILSLFPFAYSRIVIARVAGPDFPNPVPANMEAFPKLTHETREIARLVQAHASEGVMILDFFGHRDFYGWKDTLYVAFMSRIHPDKMLMMPGGLRQPLSHESAVRFLQTYSSGLLVRSDHSRFIRLDSSFDGITAQIDDLDFALHLKPIATVKSITLYHYTVSARQN